MSENLDEIIRRSNVTLKGQDVNSFETPHFVRAYRDRERLLSVVEKLQAENKELKRRLDLAVERLGFISKEGSAWFYTRENRVYNAATETLEEIGEER